MYKLVDLSDRHILVTGGSSGIGKSVAQLSSKLGARVSIIGRNLENLESAARSLNGHGHNFYEFDVTSFSQIDDLLKKIVCKSGPIDGFVHSAGMEMTRPLKVLKVENYIEVFNVNTISAFEFAKTLLKKGNISNSVSFVFIASIVGLLGQSGKTAYSASKGALIAAAKCLALELAPKGVRVNTILPALVESEMSKAILESLSDENKENILKMHPLGFGNPEDIANMTVFLLSTASKWITGAEFIVDGGYSAS